jgi:hypothetical protein
VLIIILYKVQSQAFIRWFVRRLPTEAARLVRVEFVMDIVALGQVSSQYFWFLLPILISRTTHSYNIRSWYDKPSCGRGTKYQQEVLGSTIRILSLIRDGPH